MHSSRAGGRTVRRDVVALEPPQMTERMNTLKWDPRRDWDDFSHGPL